MRTLSVCLVSSLVFLLFGGAAGAQEDAPEDAFTVLSYNIRYLNRNDGDDVWSNRRDAVGEVIRQADLIGLQEVVEDQLNDIRARTSDHAWYGVGRNDGKQQGEMTAIGYRKAEFGVMDQGTFWLSPTPDQVGSKGWDAALPRIASWLKLRHEISQSQLMFVNTHFDHRGAGARRESAVLLRKWVASKRGQLPVILVGDLNAQLDDPPLRSLLGASTSDAPALFDARAAPGITDDGPSGTWNGFSRIAAGRRIDHILYFGELQVTRFQTLDPRTPEGRFASDHLPVKATIRIAP